MKLKSLINIIEFQFLFQYIAARIDDWKYILELLRKSF